VHKARRDHKDSKVHKEVDLTALKVHPVLKAFKEQMVLKEPQDPKDL
jgi:hypothetical protein